MIVVIDNYDSFTFNLVQLLGKLGEEIHVVRNDHMSVQEIRGLKPEKIVISPGPGRPEDGGVSMDVIREFGKEIPVLGVCLGHQAIGFAFDADVVRADRIMHGKTSDIINDGKTIFKGLPNPFVAGRYHSLILKKDSIPPCLEISARTEEGE